MIVKINDVEELITLMYQYANSSGYLLDGYEYETFMEFYNEGLIENNDFGIDTTSVLHHTEAQFFRVLQEMVLDGKIKYDLEKVTIQ